MRPRLPAHLLIFVALLASCVDSHESSRRSFRASSPDVTRDGGRYPTRDAPRESPMATRPPVRHPEDEAAPAPAPPPPPLAAPMPTMVACAGSAARESNGKIDVDKTIAELTRVGCNAYLYDLPAKSDAWLRLPQFADAARRQGIDVYVYLAPFTLARKGGEDRQDGPFGTDYVKWCDAIARVAADHPSIAGVVMDDFASNVADDRFTVDYVRRMRAALTVRGRPLRFLPVLYFSLPLNETLSVFGPQFGDGAILAYPRAGRELDVANLTLNDAPRGASFGTTTPKHKLLKPGQGTFARATLTVEQARRASRLTFFINDQNATESRGRHRLVARVDGRTVWEHEVADENFAQEVNVPLRTTGGTCELQIGVLADEPSDEAIVHIAFDDVSILSTDGTRMPRAKWREGMEDGMEIGIVPPRDADQPPRWHVPLTVLLAGAPFEHAKRYNEPGTPEAIAGRVGNAVDWTRAGKTNGLVVWFLSLDGAPASRAVLEAVASRTQALAHKG